MKKLIIQIVLIAISAFLIFKVYESIQEPVEYEKAKSTRAEVIITKITQIKNLQIEFKKVYGHYTSSFDTLIDFYQNGKIPFVLKIGSNDTLSEAKALQLKLIRRDTSYIPVKDSLFKDVASFNIQNIMYVPFTDKKVKFEMEATTFEKSGYFLPVFEIRCYMKDYLYDIKEQELLVNEINIMKEEEKFPGLKLGSLTEVSVDGNWQ